MLKQNAVFSSTLILTRSIEPDIHDLNRLDPTRLDPWIDRPTCVKMRIKRQI